jgi:hypothetical protein
MYSYIIKKADGKFLEVKSVGGFVEVKSVGADLRK